MDPAQTLSNAMEYLAADMFKNGIEEGNRIWEDWNDPLNQAFRILAKAHAQFKTKEAMTLLEHHRQLEEAL